MLHSSASKHRLTFSVPIGGSEWHVGAKGQQGKKKDSNNTVGSDRKIQKKRRKSSTIEGSASQAVADGVCIDIEPQADLNANEAALQQALKRHKQVNKICYCSNPDFPHSMSTSGALQMLCLWVAIVLSKHSQT